MDKEAVVRGEVHIGKRDREALFDRDLSKYDALYVEGRSNTIKLSHYTNRYWLYLIGVLTLRLLYTSFNFVYSILELDNYNLKKEAEKHGLKFEDETDLELDELYNRYDPRMKTWFPITLVGLFILLVIRALFVETIDVGGIETAIPYWFVPLAFGMIIPFSYFNLLEEFGSDFDRDIEMATNIASQTESRGQDQILVLVGDAHVEPITDQLETQGYNVTPERSSHWLARIKRAFST